MTIFIEDSPRANLVTWITDSVAAGLAQGAVVSPWASPWETHGGPGRKPSAKKRIDDLHAQGVEVWFDPMTHVLQMAGVGDVRFYDEYDLWAGARGDLSDQALREEHVGRVFAIQDELSTPYLAPTILLHSASNNDSVVALELAREAIRRDPNCRLTVAGTTSFWDSGTALDAHIGALDALAPGGWFLVVARPSAGLPVATFAEEVHGLCRTSRALSDGTPVHISHGDLAALPAVVAGATTVGSGWDQRQRVCSYADYGPRDPDAPGGGWYQRPTLRGLLGSLLPAEATVLESREPALVALLGGLPVPAVRETFAHHLTVLSSLVTQLQSEADPQLRYHALRQMYVAATGHWPTVQSATNSSLGAKEWLAALLSGLDLYANTEGW